MAKRKKSSVDIIKPEKEISFDKTEELFKVWNDVEYYAETYCKVWDKQNAKIIPFKLLPTQRRVLNGYEKHGKNIILKYRQGGISTVTEMFLSHMIISTPDIKIAVVANTVKLARKFLKETTDFIEHLPDFLKIRTTKNSAEHKIYSNKTEIMALAASKDGVRGFTPDVMVLDEAAFMENGSDFWQSALGSMGAGGKIFMISTPNSHDAVYYTTYEGALNKRNKFNLIEIRWWEDSRFNHDLKFKLNDADETSDIWIKNKQGEKELDLVKCFELLKQGYKPYSSWFESQCAGFDYNPRRIAQELEGSFIGSGGNLINQESIEGQEAKNVKAPLKCEFRDKNFWIWKDPEPEKRYVMGVDASSGNAEDYTGIQIIDIDTGEQVAEYQGRIKPEDLGDLVYQYAIKYNSAFVVMDITGGSGSIPMLILLNRGYKNIYYTESANKAAKEKLQNFLDSDGRTPGFLIGNNRTVIIQDFEKVVRLNEFIIRSTRLMSEIKTFVWNEGKSRYDHSRSAHDDLIFGSILAFSGLAKYNQTNNDSEKAKRMANWSLNNQSNTPDLNDNTPPKSSTKNEMYHSPFSKNRFDNDMTRYQNLLFRGLKRR